MCMRHLAADIRIAHDGPGVPSDTRVLGGLITPEGTTEGGKTLHDVADKLLHGIPSSVQVVAGGRVRLILTNGDEAHPWIEFWFDAREALNRMSVDRYISPAPPFSPMHRQVEDSIRALGIDHFL